MWRFPLLICLNMCSMFTSYFMNTLTQYLMLMLHDDNNKDLSSEPASEKEKILWLLALVFLVRLRLRSKFQACALFWSLFKVMRISQNVSLCRSVLTLHDSPAGSHKYTSLHIQPYQHTHTETYLTSPALPYVTKEEAERREKMKVTKVPLAPFLFLPLCL